ncbi:hypothetical protein ABZT17_32940 [Streptomyces sp. NPDC005648]|uniref:hypothetical protein n=1 Tax=Streptomyces sp. NPDC005648 TaxID=3157044 RepID=UPI0033A67EA2
MTASAAVRGLRAAVFAALCVLLAAGGHTLATGMTPAVWAQAVGFVPVFGAGYLLGGRERSLGAIGAGTLTAQAGLHLTFDAVGPHSAMVMPGMHMSSHAHAVTPHATAVHVAAALALTWWLRRGEAALWSLLRRTAALVPGLLAWWRVSGGALRVPDAPDSVRRPCAEGPRPLRSLLLRHALRRRGPPAGTPYPI